MTKFLPEDRVSIQEALQLPFFKEIPQFEDFDDFGFKAIDSSLSNLALEKAQSDTPVFSLQSRVLKAQPFSHTVLETKSEDSDSPSFGRQPKSNFAGNTSKATEQDSLNLFTNSSPFDQEKKRNSMVIQANPFQHKQGLVPHLQQERRTTNNFYMGSIGINTDAVASNLSHVVEEESEYKNSETSEQVSILKKQYLGNNVLRRRSPGVQPKYQIGSPLRINLRNKSKRCSQMDPNLGMVGSPLRQN